MTVWVIMWYYYDNSGFGLVDRAFTDEDEARWQIKLLHELGDKRFELHSLEVK